MLAQHPIDDPAAFVVLDVRIQAVFADLPKAVLLEPFAQKRHETPVAGVDVLGQRRDGFGPRRQRTERIAENFAEQIALSDVLGEKNALLYFSMGYG